MDRLIEEVLDAAALKPSRRDLQTHIERDIENLRPDFYSAQEILAVLIASLKARFYDQDLDEVDWMSQRLTKAMQDAHENEDAEEDMAKWRQNDG